MSKSHSRNKLFILRTDSISSETDHSNIETSPMNLKKLKTLRENRIKKNTFADDSPCKLSIHSLTQSIQDMETQWKKLKNSIHATPRSTPQTFQKMDMPEFRLTLPTDSEEKYSERTTCLTEREGKILTTEYKKIPIIKKKVIINDDVWIGSGVEILPGICIGKGAVIGAGSVVTKDVPENAIVVGNPARVLKIRSIK